MILACLCLFCLISPSAGSPAPDFWLPGFNAVEAAAAGPAVQVPPAALPAPEKEWTVMVYMNGKNDLAASAFADVNEMEDIGGSSAEINVVVEYGAYKRPVKRLYVVKDENQDVISSPAVETPGPVDMGDWRNLAEFISWSKLKYPAKRYLLIVWNHGSGWKSATAGGGKGISYDDETGHHITTPQLAMALREGGRVDIFATDACLMQMAEVAYEIRRYADVIVGSEETEPGTGYSYHQVLYRLRQAATAATEEAAAGLVKAYQVTYSFRKSATTISAVRTSALDELAALTLEFTRASRQCGSAALAAARDGAKRYFDADNKDLYSFLEKVEAAGGCPGLPERSAALRRHISERLVLANAGFTPEPAPDRESHGIAVYLPACGYRPDHGDLAWTRNSGWGELASRLAAPCRKPASAAGR